jgi:hypothetical protein
MTHSCIRQVTHLPSTAVALPETVGTILLRDFPSPELQSTSLQQSIRTMNKYSKRENTMLNITYSLSTQRQILDVESIHYTDL